MEPLLLVGLDELEITELRRRLDRSVLALATLSRIRVDRGRLLVENPNFMNHFVPVERMAYHAIFEDDFEPGGRASPRRPDRPRERSLL